MKAVDYGKVDYETKYETQQKLEDGKQQDQFEDDKIFLAVLDRKREIKFVELNNNLQSSHKPHIVDIDTESAPMVLRFNSATSKIKIQQNHRKNNGEVEESRHIEEPHHFKLHVHKPVIQDVHEVITPFRNIYQEIRPVVENVQIVVTKASSKNKKNSHKKPQDNNYDDSQVRDYPQQKYDNIKQVKQATVYGEQQQRYYSNNNVPTINKQRQYDLYQHRSVQY